MKLSIMLLWFLLGLASAPALAQSSGFTSKTLCPPNSNCDQNNEVPGAFGGGSNGGVTNDLPRQAPPPAARPPGGTNNGVFTNELPQQPFPSRPKPRLRDINCFTGYQIVRNARYRRIWAYDCLGTVYRYRGIRGGQDYQIAVRRRDGQIIWTRAVR